MRYVVTGGAGFVGSNIVKLLVREGHEVTVIDNLHSGKKENLESVFVQQGQQLVPFFIESISLRSEKAIVAFEDIHSIEQAAPLKGLKLFLPLAVLPELKGDEFYLHDLIGFKLIEPGQ